MIFAVGFDGTIVEHKFPKIGEELEGATETLCMLQEAGHKIIIWTCRCEPYLSPVSKWFKQRNFVPDAVNSNFHFVPGFAMPKILADVYIDDRNFPPFSGWAAVREKFLK